MQNLQLQVKEYCLQKNGKTPDSWDVKNENDKFFYIEKCSGKKRYGTIKNCEHCKRMFVARLSWSSSVTVCSNFCGIAKKVKKVKVSCSWCKKEIQKTNSELKNSKHGFHFCDRKCKEEAQKVGGIKDIQPSHYKDGAAAYSKRALRHYGCKCTDCNIIMKTFLEVHHKDGNRKNGKLESLEVVCNIHHMLRHMKQDEKGSWIVDFHSLTPRDKLEELKKLLVVNI